jgi:hypothetical protein
MVDRNNGMKKKPLLPLSASAEALLPPPGESMKCSVHTAQLEVNPAGTAISASCVILVDTPQPWPKPVFTHPYLHDVEGKSIDPDGLAVRVLATVPRGGQELRACAFRRTESGTVAASLSLTGLTAAEAVAKLRDAADPRLVEGATEISANAILVCTQGTHDVCCGAQGSTLVKRIEGDHRLAGFPLFRVSHTGGHRFAPTAMTLPDGRMWAFIDVDQLVTALTKTAPPAEVTAWCRGSWEAPTPRYQAAEVAALASGGWPAGAATFQELDDEVIRVTRDGETIDVKVTTSRDIPVIRCRADGGLPAKPSKEFAATVI